MGKLTELYFTKKNGLSGVPNIKRLVSSFSYLVFEQYHFEHFDNRRFEK